MFFSIGTKTHIISQYNERLVVYYKKDKFRALYILCFFSSDQNYTYIVSTFESLFDLRERYHGGFVYVPLKYDLFCFLIFFLGREIINMYSILLNSFLIYERTISGLCICVSKVWFVPFYVLFSNDKYNTLL